MFMLRRGSTIKFWEDSGRDVPKGKKLGQGARALEGNTFPTPLDSSPALSHREFEQGKEMRWGKRDESHRTNRKDSRSEEDDDRVKQKGKKKRTAAQEARAIREKEEFNEETAQHDGIPLSPGVRGQRGVGKGEADSSDDDEGEHHGMFAGMRENHKNRKAREDVGGRGRFGGKGSGGNPAQKAVAGFRQKRVAKEIRREERRAEEEPSHSVSAMVCVANSTFLAITGVDPPHSHISLI